MHDQVDFRAARRRRAQRVPRRYRAVEERFVAGNHVKLLRDGAEAFLSMLEAIQTARRQILLEMYWFDSDATGRRFAEALVAAARRGVEVAIIYDSLGSWEADATMFDELAAAGARVIEFNPVMPWKKAFRLARLSMRNHRKILVVDCETGFTGGVNLSNRWAPVSEGGLGWRDDMLRLQGPAVAGLVEMFFSTWLAEGGGPLLSIKPGQSDVLGSQGVRVLGENFSRNRREIVSAYLYNIYRAKKTIYITNSYFAPNPSVVRALKRAGDRGVDVRVLLPAKSDVEIVRYAGRAMWGTLMRHGVRIYEWVPGMLHSKTAVIDARWSTIGTFNLDYRSLLSDLEVNVSVLDEGFGALMEQSFLRDLKSSKEVDPHEFSFRPWGNRVLELPLYALRSFL